MKYICKKVNPEYQESPFWLDYEDDNIMVNCYDGLYIIPNRKCRGLKEEAFADIMARAENLVDEWEFIQHKKYYASYFTITEALNDYLPRADGKNWNSNQVHAWKSILENFGKWEFSDDAKCKILSLVFGGEWDTREIHGCCQGDWARVFYKPDTWTDKSLEYLEAEYFNTGDEWECSLQSITDEEYETLIEEVGADSIDFPFKDSVFVYSHEWDNGEIRKELANAIGCKPEEIVLVNEY